jgi:hypothetical protein
MPTDPMRIREHLAAQRRHVHQLDLIEQAEVLLRAFCQQVLTAELDEAQQQLQHARRFHAALQGGDELARLLLVEEHLRATQKRVATLIRRSSEERYAAEQARALYSTRRTQILRNIKQLQLLQRRTHSTEPSRR